MYESQALTAAAASLDVESWPLLALTDVSVVQHRRGHSAELVDLFDVAELGPFRVKGRLDKIPRKYHSIVKMPEAKDRPPLVVVGVQTYSMECITGRDPTDREIRIWVLGQSAWYAIEPAEEYRGIFEGMVEKAGLWMFLQERYAKYSGKGRRIKGTAMEAYKDYIEYEPKKCKSVKAATKLFTKHHRYLLFMMLDPENDADMWQRTPVYAEFERDYESTVQEVREHFSSDKKKSKKDSMPSPQPSESEDDTPMANAAESSAEDDDEDEDASDSDSDSGDRTPITSSGSASGKNLSSKGRSILRPVTRSDIRLEHPIPDDLDGTLKRKSKDMQNLFVSRSKLSHPSSTTATTTTTTAPPPGGGVRRGANWHCTLDGDRCSYVVPNSRTREGTHAVEEHYASHGQVYSAAMQTLEEERKHIPTGGIHNLLMKLQSMNQQWENARPSPLKGL
ncbi:hypothetical protein EDC01DRAFT_637856 [Geopyxis carbonaria]|nr:hypothetical protein EDC01DRAFT_637856 [Geopyxis carbonaria]